MIVFIGIHRILGEVPYSRMNYWRIETNQIFAKGVACCLLLARSRPEETTVFAAATETPRGERAHAVGAHVAEGHKPYLKFIWRDVICQLCRRCPFGQPREAP